MKLTLLADIHGNLPALETVLRHAHAQGADGTILNLGDMMGYGPCPEEIVRWSRSPKIVSILGDYDQKVLSKVQRKDNWRNVKTPDKRDMFAWTYQALTKASRTYLKDLPEQQIIEVEGVRILLTHGNDFDFGDPGQLDMDKSHLVDLAVRKGVSVVVSGHTHQAFSFEVDGILFINPGTVGRPDDGDPRASYAVLVIDASAVKVQHFRVSYDIMAVIRGLRRAGLAEVFTRVIRQGLNYKNVVSRHDEFPLLEPSGTIALLTDFGCKEHFVGVLKGVIMGISPQVNLVDVSHQVQPQSVEEGAHILSQTVPFFPAGTVHVAVVDPGLGTTRRALAAQIGSSFFVVPDSGLLTPLLEAAQVEDFPIKLISLTKPDFWLPEVSAGFHGRDVYAPIGAHIANGIPLNCLGDEINDPLMISLP